MSKAEAVMPYLKHSHNGEVVSIHELNSLPITIGRSRSCEIQVDDPTVSSVHARIESDNQVYTLRDQNSTNGVLVAGERITAVHLSPGLEFTIGTRRFEFVLDLPVDLERTLKIKKSWIPGIFYTQ